MKPKTNRDNENLTADEANKLLAVDEGQVHTFIDVGFSLVGANWELDAIKKKLADAYQIVKAGEGALRMKHGIVIIPFENYTQLDLLFVQTSEEFNAKELEKLKDDTNV